MTYLQKMSATYYPEAWHAVEEHGANDTVRRDDMLLRQVYIHYAGDTAIVTGAYSVYWFDDQPWGGCRIPDSWKIYYKDANGNWQPVENPDGYPVAKGEPCTVNFKPVKTTALKLEVTMNKRLSAGVFEWIVK